MEVLPKYVRDTRKSLEYAKVTKSHAQMEVREEAFAEAQAELEDMEKRQEVIMPIISSLKFDLKTLCERNLEQCRSLLRDALLKFNDIEREINFHQKKVDGYQVRVKTSEDLYHKTSENFKNFDARIFKSKEILTHCTSNYNSFPIQLGNMKGCGAFVINKPILKSCKSDDSFQGFITIKACPICEDWFPCKNIVVAFYRHTYHPFCLFSHLQKSIRCAIEFYSSPI